MPGIVFNNVTWSLFYEMVFYPSLPLVVMLSRRLVVPVIGAIISAGIVFAYGPSLIGFYSQFFLFLFAGRGRWCTLATAIETVAHTFPDAIIVAFYCALGGLMAAGYLSTSQFVWLFAGLGFVIICKVIVGGGMITRLYCLAAPRQTRPDLLFVLSSAFGCLSRAVCILVASLASAGRNSWQCSCTSG